LTGEPKLSEVANLEGNPVSRKRDFVVTPKGTDFRVIKQKAGSNWFIKYSVASMQRSTAAAGPDPDLEVFGKA
jgi:hypothetical protein